MAMNYTSLIAAKGTSGAVATWVSYTLLDIPVIIDEAQTLLYTLLRTREMLTDLVFMMPTNSSYIVLPARFLDPIGRIYQPSLNMEVRHKDANWMQRNRDYTEVSGSLGTDPFTTVSGSDSVNVALTGHGFTQDSQFYTTGATAFNGATIVGTFPISAIVDANNFTIDISSLGTTPIASGSGGDTAITYLCDYLIPGTPYWFGIWNERIYFDSAFVQNTMCRMQYYRSQPLLSASNLTNFLTDRYPHLMRVACMAQAANFMKDDAEYQKHMTALAGIVQRTSINDDMSMRGMEIETENP